VGNYFIAKTKERGFIGQFTSEKIVRKFRAGESPGNYVTTKSVDPSFLADL
jgi:hypothetical protein